MQPVGPGQHCPTGIPAPHSPPCVQLCTRMPSPWVSGARAWCTSSAGSPVACSRASTATSCRGMEGNEQAGTSPPQTPLGAPPEGSTSHGPPAPRPGSYLSAVEAQQDVHLQRGHVEDAVSKTQLGVAQPRPLQPPGPRAHPARPALACQGSVSLTAAPGAPTEPPESPDPTAAALTVPPEVRELIQRGAQRRREEPPGLLHVAQRGHGPAARGQHQHLHLQRIGCRGLPRHLGAGTEGGSAPRREPSGPRPPSLRPSPQPRGSPCPGPAPAAAGPAPAAGRGRSAAAAPPTPPGRSASPGGSGGGSTAPSAPPPPLPARRAPAPAAGPPGTACHSRRSGPPRPRRHRDGPCGATEPRALAALPSPGRSRGSALTGRSARRCGQTPGRRRRRRAPGSAAAAPRRPRPRAAPAPSCPGSGRTARSPAEGRGWLCGHGAAAAGTGHGKEPRATQKGTCVREGSRQGALQACVPTAGHGHGHGPRWAPGLTCRAVRKESCSRAPAKPWPRAATKAACCPKSSSVAPRRRRYSAQYPSTTSGACPDISRNRCTCGHGRGVSLQRD